MPHTPGPWELWEPEDDRINGGSFRPLRGDMNWLGDLRANSNEDDDNARLIATSPDLLAACKELVIVAAAGSPVTKLYPLETPPRWYRERNERLEAAIQVALVAIDKAEGKE